MVSPFASLCAPAKLNLSLHVIGRRDDGYHLLDSLVVFLDLADRIDLYEAAEDALEDELKVTGPFATRLGGRMEDNLLMRAVALLRQAGAAIPPLRVVLEKHVPVQAGLGGGSSDAASMLRGLMQHYGFHLIPDDVRALCLRLGADVPVCLEAKPSLMQGIGEMVLNVPMPEQALWVVLVNPGMALSTPLVFKRMHLPEGLRPSIGPLPTEERQWKPWLGWLGRARNDLQAPAMELAPVIGEFIRAMWAVPGCQLARMSGSGATCFGLFLEEGQAKVAAGMLKGQWPEAWIAVKRLACAK